MFLHTCNRIAAGVIFMLCLGGCATPQTQVLLKTRPEKLPVQVELSAVPYFSQESHQCGPAALAMAMNAGGAKVTPQEMARQVYLPGLAGSLQVEMLSATRRNGMLAYVLPPKLEDILAEVADGSPVVVLQNLALSWYKVMHYAVVVGYDLQREEIILRSGAERRQVMSLTTFEHTWGRSGFWAMLALSPGQVPRTATETSYISAVVALEKTKGLKSAKPAYEAALRHWPRNLTAHIGLGNAAYAVGEVKSAEKYYLQATLDHPESAIAFNNLAQTLVDQQRFVEALAAAVQAVGLGGAEQATARDTLEYIKKNM